MERKPRRVEIPMYPDVGCEVSPSCLRCPLPHCRHDKRAGIRSLTRERRDAQMASAIQTEDLTVPQVARRFGVSERTVFRALKG